VAGKPTSVGVGPECQQSKRRGFLIVASLSVVFGGARRTDRQACLVETNRPPLR
jgi:hypothetical protein